MASRAASKLLMPPGRLCSDGLKHLVGAVKGPLARSQARYNSSAATENPTSNINQEVGGHERFFSDLVAKHEKTIGELESKYDKALSDLKQGFDRELIVLRYDLKKEAEDRLQLSKDETKRLKTYGWLFGASSAFLSRFSKIPDFIFKRPKGDL